MAFDPTEQSALIAAINETALAIDDRVNATTTAQRTAARARYNAGMKALLIAFANMLKYGSQGDYSA